MKTIPRMMIVFLLVTPQFAAAAEKAKDGSQLAIWVFLGICALIVVIQLFPTLILFYGLIRGLVAGRKEGAVIPIEVVNDK